MDLILRQVFQMSAAGFGESRGHYAVHDFTIFQDFVILLLPDFGQPFLLRNTGPDTSNRDLFDSNAFPRSRKSNCGNFPGRRGFRFHMILLLPDFVLRRILDPTAELSVHDTDAPAYSIPIQPNMKRSQEICKNTWTDPIPPIRILVFCVWCLLASPPDRLRLIPLATMTNACHDNGMKSTLELDTSNRIVITRELRKAAGIPRRQKLVVSATPGRIVLEVEPNTMGQVVKRGLLRVWTGDVPETSIQDAVDQARHYSR